MQMLRDYDMNMIVTGIMTAVTPITEMTSRDHAQVPLSDTHKNKRCFLDINKQSISALSHIQNQFPY